MENNNFGYFGGTQAKQILILGESHHWSPTDKNKSSEENAKKEREYKTECVIKNYLQNGIQNLLMNFQQAESITYPATMVR